MKGTFLKDIMNLKGQMLYYAFVIVFFFAVGAITGNIYFYAGVSIFCGVVAPLSAVAYDEKDNWDKFALASGVSRKELAFSRYALGLSLFVPVWAFSFVFFAIPSFRTAENLYTVLTFGGLGLAVMDAVLPLVFKLGVEKARTVYIVLVVAVMAFCVGAASLIGLAGGYVPLVACAAALAVGVIGLPVSAAVSLSVYKYKDF